jgi:ribosome-associated protein
LEKENFPPSGIEVAPGIYLPEAALRFTFSRSSGPGGQNVNKLSTKAQLHLALSALREKIGPAATDRLMLLAGPARLTADGDLLISVEETRSQRMNRDICIERLRTLLLQALTPPKTRRRTRPTRSSKQRRLDAKKHRGVSKRGRSAPRDES